MPGRRARRTNRTPTREWGPAFLRKLATCGNIREAAAAAHVGRQTVYERRDSDPTFKAAMADALEDACDRLEEAARKRGLRKSDKLLAYLLTVHRYKKVVLHEITGKNGGPIRFVTAKDVDDDTLANIAAGGGGGTASPPEGAEESA